MSYNTDLQNNNTSLQEILATINNLPEAGSGGGSSGGENSSSSLEWIDVKSLPFTGSGSNMMGLTGNLYDCTSYMDATKYFALIVKCTTSLGSVTGLTYLVSDWYSSQPSRIVTLEEDMYGASICLVENENGTGGYITEAYMLVIPK